jgi:hypothetical protein
MTVRYCILRSTSIQTHTSARKMAQHSTFAYHVIFTKTDVIPDSWL